VEECRPYVIGARPYVIDAAKYVNWRRPYVTGAGYLKQVVRPRPEDNVIEESMNTEMIVEAACYSRRYGFLPGSGQ
jgi:hypothetical protein